MTLRIKKPGVVFINGNRITISHFSFDTDGRSEDVTDEEIVECVRNYVATQFANALEEEVPTSEKRIVAPVSMATEREAEMEAYLLINRCQGNS
jgi:septin family protein